MPVNFSKEYFAKIKTHSFLIQEASQLLLKKVQTQEVSIYDQIQALEKRGNSLMDETAKIVTKSFWLVIDKEDAFWLSSILDSVLDGVERVSNRVSIFGMEAVSEDTIRFIKKLDEASAEIDILITQINQKQSFNQTKKCIEKLHQMEIEADIIHRESLNNLFATEANPIKIIQKREILQLLENTFDTIEVLSNFLNRLRLKYD